MSSRVSLTSRRDGAFLSLVGHPSSDIVTIEIPCGVDVINVDNCLFLAFSDLTCLFEDTGKGVLW